jgi:hypothetical protein
MVSEGRKLNQAYRTCDSAPTVPVNLFTIGQLCGIFHISYILCTVFRMRLVSRVVFTHSVEAVGYCLA